MSIENGSTTACVLRLGGIYGDASRNYGQWFKSMAGEQVSMVGDHHISWTSSFDAINGIVFAIENNLSGIYNLVNDDRKTRRELASEICEQEGLPPIVWTGVQDPCGRFTDAKVLNDKIKDAGFVFMSKSLVSKVFVGR